MDLMLFFLIILIILYHHAKFPKNLLHLYNDRKNMLRLTTYFPFATSETGHDY